MHRSELFQLFCDYIHFQESLDAAIHLPPFLSVQEVIHFIDL